MVPIWDLHWRTGRESTTEGPTRDLTGLGRGGSGSGPGLALRRRPGLAGSAATREDEEAPVVSHFPVPARNPCPRSPSLPCSLPAGLSCAFPARPQKPRPSLGSLTATQRPLSPLLLLLLLPEAPRPSPHRGAAAAAAAGGEGGWRRRRRRGRVWPRSFSSQAAPAFRRAASHAGPRWWWWRFPQRQLPTREALPRPSAPLFPFALRQSWRRKARPGASPLPLSFPVRPVLRGWLPLFLPRRRRRSRFFVSLSACFLFSRSRQRGRKARRDEEGRQRRQQQPEEQRRRRGGGGGGGGRERRLVCRAIWRLWQQGSANSGGADSASTQRHPNSVRGGERDPLLLLPPLPSSRPPPSLPFPLPPPFLPWRSVVLWN
ncbi:uncharacterized protein [Anolis sagrei]|uniref:uncharacterized protein n=1 Tax=Anolis sagrei TaxID=38937 RepID=UPI0035212D47